MQSSDAELALFCHEIQVVHARMPAIILDPCVEMPGIALLDDEAKVIVERG